MTSAGVLAEALIIFRKTRNNNHWCVKWWRVFQELKIFLIVQWMSTVCGYDLQVISLHIITKKVKVSLSLIAVGAVGVRVPLYLGHS